MGYQGVMRLAKDPKVVTDYGWKRLDWLKIVKGCYEEAKRLDGKSFAWSMVANKGWVPNLRKLERYGILEHDDTLSDKREAWWIMLDVDGVGRALRELGYL